MEKNTALNHCLDTLSEGLSVDFGFLRYAKMMTQLTTFFAGFYVYQGTRSWSIRIILRNSEILRVPHCKRSKETTYIPRVGRSFFSSKVALLNCGTQGKNPPKTTSKNTNWREGNKSGTKDFLRLPSKIDLVFDVFVWCPPVSSTSTLPMTLCTTWRKTGWLNPLLNLKTATCHKIHTTIPDHMVTYHKIHQQYYYETIPFSLT